MFMMGLDDENVIEEMRSMRESEIQSDMPTCQLAATMNLGSIYLLLP